MKIELYDPTVREQWDHFVFANPEAGIAHLSANFLLGEHKDGARNRSVLLCSGKGELIAVMPILELRNRKLRLVTIRELSCSCPLFKPGLQGPEQRRAFSILIEYVKALAAKVGAERIAISYPASAAGQLAIDRYGYLPVKEFGFLELNTVALFLDLRPDEETLFRNLDSKCRNMIRRTQKSGASVFPISSRDLWLSCYELNLQTLGPACFSREAMGILWDEFIAKRLAVAVAVQFEDRILSVAVVSVMNRAAYYWLAFNAQPRVLPGSNNYALWEAIRACRNRDVCVFNLGSLEFSSDPKQRSIAAFKAAFGGRPAYTLSGVLERKPGKRLMLDWAENNLSRIRRRLSRPNAPATPPARTQEDVAEAPSM